jgi:TolA-binding protein
MMTMRTPGLERRGKLLLSGGVSLLIALMASGRGGTLRAQDAWGAGRTFTSQRVVHLAAAPGQPGIVVTEFLTQGELRPDGRNLVVYDNAYVQRPVPWRVLQVGPGDFCRVAFQTVRGQKAYNVYYGGPAAEKPPAWTAGAGLLLETRRWRSCDLNSAESVREGFAAAESVGGDFVPTVFHRFNPFAPGPEPFLSRYRGTLQIDTAGPHRFYTSSQDCSFLSIDGRPVVAAPGAHGPTGDARVKGEVTLTAGPHAFEYLHAAAGPDACMVAAWQPPGAAQPEAIPPRAFGASGIAHLPAIGLRHRIRGSLPDFTAEVVGEAPVADSAQPMVRVQFRDAAPQGVAYRARVVWDFGDGQTSDRSDPVHVYLQPGLYAMKMAVVRAGGSVESVSRVQVHRAVVLPDAKKPPDQLADYLPLLDRYDPAKLPPAALLQLVRAYDQEGQFSRAARVGKAGLLAVPAPSDEKVVHALAQLVGPLLRDRLDDPAAALAVWQAAGQAVRREPWKAECLVEAADVCLNDLLRRGEAKPLLEAAARLASAGDPALAGRLQRVWGDWYARGGKKDAANAAYERAAAALEGRRTTAEQDAWRGAFSRSTEAFLHDKELDRALAELRRWQEAFPGDKLEGYLPLLQARYWTARGKLPNAIAVASDLVTINPDSPYADQLVYLAADCEEKLGHTDRARAGYQALVTDYPGSVLVGAARQKLTQLAPGGPPPPKPPRK